MKHIHKYSKPKVVRETEEVDQWGGTPKGKKTVVEKTCKCGSTTREEVVEVYG